MQKILLLLFLIPFIAVAQNKDTIDLTPGKCKGTLINKTNSTVKSIEPDEDGGQQVAKLKFEDGNRISVITLKKPMTIKLIKSTFTSLMKTKSKTVEVKAIVNNATDLVIERKYKDNNKVIYKALYLVALKGKEFMIETNELDTLEEAKILLQTMKTFKLK